MIFRDSRTNYIINGAMTFHQRFVGTAYNYSGTTPLNACVADRWRVWVGGNTSKNFLMVRSTDVPTYAQSGEQFVYSSSLTINTGATFDSSSDYLAPFTYLMEGYDVNQIKGKSVNISFWFKSSVTGIYTVSLGNNRVIPVFRSLASSFTVNTANTWEFKSINIAIEDYPLTTNGSTNGAGLMISIAPTSARTDTLASSINSWLTPNNPLPLIAPGNANYHTVTGAVLRLTGVQLVVGTDSPTEYSYYGGTFTGELLACQRYYEKSYGFDVLPGTVTSNGVTWGSSSASFNTVSGRAANTIVFKAEKRAVPSMTPYNPLTGAANQHRDDTAGTNVGGGIDIVGLTGARFVTSGSPTGNGCLVHWIADAEF